MRLLYISSYQFKQENGKNYSLPAYGDNFWNKYLDVFDGVDILGEKVKSYLSTETMAELKNPEVSLKIIPGITNPKDFKNDKEVHKILTEEIKKASAILIKPSSRKGIMAIKIAEQYRKPYMVELTGDLKLTLRQNPNILKRLYSPYLHKRILKAIKPCKFGLYVTKQYLEKVYPISGKQVGVTDACIDYISNEVFERRLQNINSLDVRKNISIGLIGFYHDTRKGIDTAIKALSLIPVDKINAELNILALGNEKDRQKWKDYAESVGFKHKLNFPEPLNSTQEVLEWIDTQDINILPSRSEGLPRCIVEAMSRGCPVISSNVCGIPELIENKWLHKPGDYIMLSRLIVEMVSDKNNMIEAAKINFEKSKEYLRPVLTEKRNAFLTEFKKYCEKVSEKSL